MIFFIGLFIWSIPIPDHGPGPRTPDPDLSRSPRGDAMHTRHFSIWAMPEAWLQIRTRMFANDFASSGSVGNCIRGSVVGY